MTKAETSFSYKLKSHPDKLLITHLQNVYMLMEAELQSKQINFNLNQDEFKKLVKVVAFSHDFGKATTYFQEKLEGKSNASKLTHHSLISCLFAYYLGMLLDIKNPFIPCWIVKKHHGNLDNIDNDSSIDYEHTFKKQLNSIDPVEISNLYNELFKEENITIDINDFKQKITTDSCLYDDIFNSTDDIEKNLEQFFIVEFLFSLLVDADKLDAGINNLDAVLNIKKEVRRFNIPYSVDEYKQIFKADTGQLNVLRNLIYDEANEYVNNLDLNQKIYSINVPTGTGKTLTSLSFALKLKDKISKERGFNPRIIYCLPFTSIIDQNHQVFEDVLTKNDIVLNTHILLKHHHLTELTYTTENEEYETDKSLLLTESWMSSIIVTSFAQLFHSMFTNKNRNLKKFHNIANSIVILDEIQSIPPKYWKLVNESFKLFSRIFNSYFILVTATMPLIFADYEINEVVRNKEKHFKNKSLNRINLVNDTNERTLEEFKIYLKEKIVNQDRNKSALIILNTISSSQEIYRFLQDTLQKFSDTEVLYLSTAILPFYRKEIIDKVKKQEKRYILVSTQVVEAGVDIDFDIVYRDLAPLDCIFQAAGRCNRHAAKIGNGEVRIVHLKDNNKFYCNYIYSNVLLEHTLAIINKKESFCENEFLELAKQYYRSIVISNNDSNQILQAMRNLEFDKTRDFKLIEEIPNSFEFFIEVNEEAQKLKQQFFNLDKFNPIERQKHFLAMRQDFYKYVLTVRLKKEQTILFEEPRYRLLKDFIFQIPSEEVEDFYELNGVGFNLTNKDQKGLLLI
jgi:CRISPR-associated endonuclease/helicase Cas3